MVLPASGNKVVRATGWDPGERPGEWVRHLIDDPAGYRTMLMQIVPGPLGPPHAHDTIEQVYVIEGDFFDEQETYRAGDFVVRMPGTMHRTGSAGGATVLVSYAPQTPR